MMDGLVWFWNDLLLIDLACLRLVTSLDLLSRFTQGYYPSASVIVLQGDGYSMAFLQKGPLQQGEMVCQSQDTYGGKRTAVDLVYYSISRSRLPTWMSCTECMVGDRAKIVDGSYVQ